MSNLTIEEWKKGLAHYEAGLKQAYADIEFNNVVIDAIKKKLSELEEVQEVKNG